MPVVLQPAPHCLRWAKASPGGRAPDRREAATEWLEPPSARERGANRLCM